MTVRPATLDDADAVAEILDECTRRYFDRPSTVDDYLADQPRATELLGIDGKDRGHPEWWEGMRVLVCAAANRQD